MRTFFSVFCTSLCMLFSNCCLAQFNGFVPGFYINQNGDTIRGYGSRKNTAALTVFKFKTQVQTSTATDISFDSCRQLSLGEEAFVNWFGPRNMAYIDKLDFSIKNTDRIITGAIPLKVLYKGNRISLYHYYDIKDHFFIKERDSIQELYVTYRYITEREKQNYIINLPKYLVTPVYQYQLFAMLNNRLTKKQAYLIEHSGYEKKSLLKLVKALDQL